MAGGPGASHATPDVTAHGPEVINISPCSAELSTQISMLINVKMLTIGGILTFISIINTTSESLKARKVIIFQHFSFYDRLKFNAYSSCA